MCRPRKHNRQPFCGPEGRFHCSDSVCSLLPALFSYLCMRVRILGVLKIVCCWANNTGLLPYACCGLHFPDSAACVLSFYHSTPLHMFEAMNISLHNLQWFSIIHNPPPHPPIYNDSESPTISPYNQSQPPTIYNDSESPTISNPNS